MENNQNKDWEELEKWAEKDKQEFVERFGVDFDQIDVEKQKKKMLKVADVMDTTTIVAIIILVIIGSLIAFIVGTVVYIRLYNLKQTYDADINPIFSMYNIKTKLVSKDVDDKGNGRYIYELKENKDIKFTVIKNKGDLLDDYRANCLKYYFEKWQSKSKESFIVEENITEQGLLEYSAHIEIENYTDIEDNANIINEFVRFIGDNFHSSWDLYLSKKELDSDEMRVYAPIDIAPTKSYYVRYMHRTNPEKLEKEKELMTKEEIEQYFSEENLSIH